jgi:KTSC domain
MNFIKVDSSNLDRVAYDEATETLAVIFHRGGEYHYRGVPKPVFDGLVSAPSTGQFFNKNIKTVYATEKVRGDL